MAVPRVTDIPRTVGSGTVEDPMIYWIIKPPVVKDGRTAGCEDAVREAAKPFGITHIWIRHANHSSTIKGPTRAKRIVKADSHITVYMGFDPDNATSQGHVYVIEQDKVPKRMMYLSERQLPTKGDNPELYAYPAKGQKVK